jgi:hypothetical protein
VFDKPPDVEQYPIQYYVLTHRIRKHLDFDVLLTVHLSVILVINQLNAQILVL